MQVNPRAQDDETPKNAMPRAYRPAEIPQSIERAANIRDVEQNDNSTGEIEQIDIIDEGSKKP